MINVLDNHDSDHFTIVVISFYYGDWMFAICGKELSLCEVEGFLAEVCDIDT